MRAMTITVSALIGYGKVRRQEVSVPRVDQLLEPPSRYSLPAEPEPTPPPAEPPPRAPRGPHLRSLVKLALRCESAEALGAALRKRYQRNAARKGGKPRDADDDALDRELDQLLSDVRSP